MVELSYWWTSALLLVFFWAFFKIKSIYSYFEKRGIPYVKPVFLLGSDVKGALGRDSIGLMFDRLYKALEGKRVGGIFLGIMPIVFVLEPEYIHKVLTTYFDHFHDRPFLIDEKVNPTEAHIFFLKGRKWKFVRHKLTPAFTSNKLKYMFDEMSKCSDILISLLDSVANGDDIDLHETLALLSTDVIATTAFGLEPETLKNPDSKFRAMGKKFFAPTFKNTFTLFLRFAFPRLVIAMKLHTTDKQVSDYFISIFKQVFEYRRKHLETRKDFVQILLQLKEAGFIENDNPEIDDEHVTPLKDQNMETFEITDELLTAQSFVFYAAGYETTSKTFYFLIYLLSTHKEAQDKAREEVRQVKKKYKEFSYEAMKELKYLENCIAETLRIFPPLPFINRECIKEFIFPDGTKIEKGTHVAIPTFSLHRDPKHFPEPEEFKPERFEEPIIPGTYLPFGEGPRICIGKRFALMTLKMTMAKLLDRYYFEKSPLTKTPIQFDTFVTLTPLHPLWVKMVKCNDL